MTEAKGFSGFGCLPIGCASVIVICVVGLIALSNRPDPLSDPRYEKGLAEIEVQNALASRLKDPTSVLWTNVRSSKVDGVWYVCGSYNAKNSFGAYTGAEAFAGTKTRVFTEKETAPSQAAARDSVMLRCR